MMDQEYPQVYLTTPGDFELARFGDQLGSVLDGNEVACVRLALTTKDELEISKIADRLRDICHARDVALVIESHINQWFANPE